MTSSLAELLALPPAITMPRGQKGKLHALEKHHQARGETQGLGGGGTQATAGAAAASGESSCPACPLSGDRPQNLPAAVTPSCPKVAE